MAGMANMANMAVMILTPNHEVFVCLPRTRKEFREPLKKQVEGIIIKDNLTEIRREFTCEQNAKLPFGLRTRHRVIFLKRQKKVD